MVILTNPTKPNLLQRNDTLYYLRNQNYTLDIFHHQGIYWQMHKMFHLRLHCHYLVYFLAILDLAHFFNTICVAFCELIASVLPFNLWFDLGSQHSPLYRGWQRLNAMKKSHDTQSTSAIDIPFFAFARNCCQPLHFINSFSFSCSSTRPSSRQTPHKPHSSE